VKIYLYDLNKISSTEVRGYRPPRSCWCHLGFL